VEIPGVNKLGAERGIWPGPLQGEVKPKASRPSWARRSRRRRRANTRKEAQGRQPTAVRAVLDRRRPPQTG